MILSSYTCGCTWVGEEHECAEECAAHAARITKAHQIGLAPKVERGWLPPADQDGARQLARAF